MIVKVHQAPNGKKIVALCDSSILGKSFDEGSRVLDLASDFYKGEEKSDNEVMRIFAGAYIVNLAGERSVGLGLKTGIINKGNVITVCGIPHAQAVLF